MSSSPSQSNNIEAVFPLSPTQEGMLYHTLKNPESAVYVGQHVMELQGADSRLLREAWRLIVAQHMSLRSVFAWKALSRPVQIVYRAYEPDWQELDFQTRDDAAAWLAADAASRFDLDERPPSRLAWLKLSPERGMLVWTRHHLLVDGWSAQLVIGELHRAYTALRHGRPWHARPDPGMAAYVAWLQKQNAAAERCTLAQRARGRAAEPRPRSRSIDSARRAVGTTHRRTTHAGTTRGTDEVRSREPAHAEHPDTRRLGGRAREPRRSPPRDLRQHCVG